MGAPARPQYPLRGTDAGGGSLVSRRHMFPIAISCSLAPEKISAHLDDAGTEDFSDAAYCESGRRGPERSDYTQMDWLPSEAGSSDTFLHYGVLFGHGHANSSIRTTMSIEAKPARRQTRFRRCLSSCKIYHVRKLGAETGVLRHESLTALKNARIRPPFRGNARWLTVEACGGRSDRRQSTQAPQSSTPSPQIEAHSRRGWGSMLFRPCISDVASLLATGFRSLPVAIN
jgi:hypothetical protein